MKKIILFTAAIFYCSQFCYSQAGELDPSFGINGIIKANVGVNYTYNFSAKKVLRQPDGSIYLIVVAPLSQVQIIKMHANGSIDSSYGHNGFSPAGDIDPNDALLQPNGKIVIVGSGFNVTRFNTDGSPDKAFGENIKKNVDFLSGSVRKSAYAAALQADGKIVVVGDARFGEFTDFYTLAVIVRYNTDGTLDNGFLGNGANLYYSNDAGLHSVALQHDGKIVVLAGFDGYNNVALQRFNINGSSDATFGNNGSKEIASETAVPVMAIQSDDKIVLGSKTLSRYNTDGNLDNAFGNDGKQTSEFPIASLSIQSNGKIVAAGSAVARYNSDGNLDDTFNGNGKQTSDFAILSIVIQNDGKVVAAGSSVVRYDIDGKLDNSFVISGTLLHPVEPGIAGYNKIALEPNGKFVATGYRQNSDMFETILVRYNADGSVDSTFSEDGIKVVDFGIQSVAVQNARIMLLAGGALSGALINYNSDGSLNTTFNGNGILYPDFPVASMAVQTDGKIVVTGTGQFVDNYGHQLSAFCTGRYNTDGSPDSSFSEDGKQITPFEYDSEFFDSRASLVAVQGDGKIVVAGEGSFEDEFGVMVRYNTDGSLDNTFAGGRMIGLGFNTLVSMAVGNNGEIATTGITSYRGDVEYYLRSVGTNGFSKDLSNLPFGNSLAFQADGKLIMGGGRALVRFTRNGNLDSSFSEDGLQTVEGFGNMAILNNKLYVVGAMNSSQHPASQAAVSRYLLDGEIQTPPTVKITSPVDGASYTANATIILSAEAGDEDGTIKKVSFYNGDKLIFTEQAPPFYRKWFNVKEGSYTITAKAIDDDGNETTSAPVHITVLPSISPSVNITSPLNESKYSAPADIFLRADAIVPNGTISKVEFFNGNDLVLTEYKTPYGNKWRNVPSGNYSFTAKVTDGNGNVITSQPVEVTVTGALSRSIVKEDKPNLSQRPLSLNVNPNPVVNVLNISIDGVNANSKSFISLISAAGVIVKTIQSKTLNNNMKLDVSSLSSGVYFIKVVNGGKILYRQFVKL